MGWNDVVYRGRRLRLFDSIDHEVLLAILAEKIHDGRFVRLIANLLSTGYLENWQYNATLSGTPQGAVVSPILSNVYLNRLDRIVEQTLLPSFNRGVQRKPNPTYMRLAGWPTTIVSGEVL